MNIMQTENLSIKNVSVIMAGLMLCLFLSALDNAIVATAMPRIIDDLKGMTYYSLPFTTYLLFSTVAIPVAGKLSDVFGRKRIVLWGIVSFLISSTLCALSVDMLMLIVARGLQGACGGVIASSAFIITAELFPVKERAKYIGILASMHGLASLLGPVMGGVITEYVSWHWIFLVNIPIGMVAIWLLNKYLPVLKHASQTNKLDVRGILVFLASILPFLFCMVEGGRLLPWTSPLLISLLIVSVFLMICFIRLERISVSPMLPAGLLKNSIFRKSAFIGAMGYVALFGLILYVPYLLQVILKKDAAFSGVMMLPMTLSMVVGGMLGGALISRYQHYRRSGIVNLSIAIVGLLLLFVFGQGISMLQMTVGLLLTGIGIGMNFPLVNIAPQSVISVTQMGILVSSIEFFQVMGGVTATSLFGKLLGTSMSLILLLCIGALAAGLVVSCLLDDKKIKEGFARQHSEVHTIKE